MTPNGRVGMLPAGTGERIVVETGMVPLTVMASHKRRERTTIMAFTEVYPAIQGLVVARG